MDLLLYRSGVPGRPEYPVVRELFTKVGVEVPAQIHVQEITKFHYPFHFYYSLILL